MKQFLKFLSAQNLFHYTRADECFCHCDFCTAESQIQNNSTMVMGAVVGVAVILLVVVAVLLLRRRLVTTRFISTFKACVIQINIIHKPADCVIMCRELERIKDTPV